MKVIGRKAEWLVGDGKACIETNVPLSQYYTIRAQYLDRNVGSKTTNYDSVLLWVRKYENNIYKTVMLGSYNSTRICYYTAGQDTSNAVVYFPYVPNSEYDVELAPQYIKVNGVSYSITQYDDVVMPIKTIRLFYHSIGWSDSPAPCGKSISLKRFEVVDNISLTPIQLTSSIPAYLSSDNLPHAAGECGMWDSVNEKFYGNANTSGAFSVENELDEYVEIDLTGIAINGKYQRVSVENTEIPQIVWNGVNAKMLMLNGEVVWLINKSYTYLIGEGAGRYINLGQYDISKIVMSIELLKTEKVKSIFFYLNATNLPNYCQIYEQEENGKLKNLMLFRNSGMSHIFDNKLQEGVNVIDIYFNSSNNPAITLNGTTYTNTANKITSFITNVRTQGCIKLITIDNLHFVPKMLLKPLPAESDSQGIARQPCTCGLWCEEQHLFYTSEDGQGFSVI